MEQIKLELPIDFNTIQEGELRYFFRPFIWEQKKYDLLWEDKASKSFKKTKAIITDIQISANTAHQRIEPKHEEFNVSPIINLMTEDTNLQKTVRENIVNTEQTTNENSSDTQNNEVTEKTISKNTTNTENNEVAQQATIQNSANTSNNEVTEKVTDKNTADTENHETAQNSMSILESYQNIAKRYK